MAEKKSETLVEDVVRTINIPVVAATRKDYQRTTMILRNFQRVVSRLAAENFLIELATSKWSKPKQKKSQSSLSYDAKKRQLVSTLVNDSKGSQGFYDLKDRFMDLWDEAMEANPKLPRFSQWIWDALQPKFMANDGNHRWKHLNEYRVPKFRNFGLSIMKCDSRSYAKIKYIDKHDIRLKLRLNPDEDDDIEVVVAGPYEYNGELKNYEANPQVDSLMRRFAAGTVSWSFPNLRLRDNRLFVDISYKTKPSERKTNSVGRTLSILLQPYHHTKKVRIDGREEERKYHYMMTTRLQINAMKPKDFQRHAFAGIRCESAIAYLDGMKANKIPLDTRLRAALDNHNMEEVSKIREIINNLSNRREAYIKSVNHNWTSELVWQARKYNCEKIVLLMPAKVKKESEEDQNDDTPVKDRQFVGTHTWRWAEFRQFLKYKSALKGLLFEEELAQLDIAQLFLVEAGEESNEYAS